ncbi:MAG TPA: hypothetical protein VFR37_03310, partial [Longimicrobium sp.]|nr:hypothetical protein [Longimicrobium sp.]
RMNDVSFQLSLLITMEQGYFDDTSVHEEFLERYNDEYPHRDAYMKRAEKVFEFIEAMDLPPRSRWWKKADVFTLIVELDRALHERGMRLDPAIVKENLLIFETRLQQLANHQGLEDVSTDYRSALSRYAHAAAQGSNHRKSRTTRGAIMESLLGSGDVEQVVLFPLEDDT